MLIISFVRVFNPLSNNPINICDVIVFWIYDHKYKSPCDVLFPYMDMVLPASWLVGSCLASPANFIYGRVLAKVLSHVTIMPVLLRPVNNFLGQVIGNASEGKNNTVNKSLSGEVTFQKCLKSGITLFSCKNSNKSQTFATGPYQRLHESRPRRIVWLWSE